MPLSAAIPAGPAPTTIRSKLRSPLLIGANIHFLPAQNHARPAVTLAVDRCPALETDAHSAESSARFSHNGAPHKRPADLIVARHSKQTPIPQRAPRGSPITERRTNVLPFIKIAASAVVPSVTETRKPFTATDTVLDMHPLRNARRQIRLSRNLRRALQQLVSDEPSRREGCRDAESLVAGRKQQILARWQGADER